MTPEVALILPWSFIHVYYHSSQISQVSPRSQVSVYRTIGPLVVFAITAAGVVPCGDPKMSPRILSIVQIICLGPKYSALLKYN